MKRKELHIGILVWLMTGILLMTGRPAEAVTRPTEGMFALYDQNRQKGIPNYITEDFILLAYSMVLGETITHMEEQILYPDFKGLVEGMLEKLEQKNRGDEIGRANLNFLRVISHLLEGEHSLSGIDEGDPILEELKNIYAAKGIASSPLMHQDLDYTQFKVRGKYNRSATLNRYFRAIKYASTVLFPVLESQSTGIRCEDADLLTNQALALSRMIMEDDGLREAWVAQDKTLSLFFGPSEDYRPVDYYAFHEEIEEGTPIKTVRTLILQKSRKRKKQPAILSSVVDVSKLETGLTPQDVLTGWRFVSPRVAPEVAAFQTLVHGKVGKYRGEGNPFSLTFIGGAPVKGYPLGLELMTLLGSREAENRLHQGGDKNYTGYPEAQAEAGARLASAEGLQAQNLMMMSYWLKRGDHFQKDESRRLNTCLAFWVHQRHEGVLYTKQSYTVVGKGLPLHPKRTMAWLEPAPELYLYLQNLARQIESRSKDSGMGKLAALLERCIGISFKELDGRSLDGDEVSFLNNLDRKLLDITGKKDRPIVVDVHTEPGGGQVLEEALGFPQIVKRSFKSGEARGALFRYYEFKYPMKKRLTDGAWREILNDKKLMDSLDLSPGSSRN